MVRDGLGMDSDIPYLRYVPNISTTLGTSRILVPTQYFLERTFWCLFCYARHPFL